MEAGMCAHRWVLLLSLWQGQFGAYPAMPPNGGHPARTLPQTRLATESSVFHQAPDTEGLWPFWVSVDVPSDPEELLPVSLTSDPQDLPQAGNTQGPKPAVSPSLKYSTSTSTALLPEPGTQILWGKESLSTSRDTAPWLQDLELQTTLTSGFTHLSPAQVEVPHRIPQPTHSLRGKDAASQNPTQITLGLPPFTVTPNGNTAAHLPPTEAQAPALPLPPESAGPQAGREGPIIGPTGGRSTTMGTRTRERLPKSGGSPMKDKQGKAGTPNIRGVLQGAVPTKTLTPTTKSPGDVVPGVDRPSGPGEPNSARAPPCDGDTIEACNPISTWSPALSEDFAKNQSRGPSPPPAPPPALTLLLVPLNADWNSAMATWGVAWELHVFGMGSLFTLVALLSTLGLLLLPLLRPPGGSYLAMAHLLLVAVGSSRAVLLFYDAYGHLDKLPAANFLLLHQTPFPCLTGAFAAVFLFLSLRWRVRLPGSSCQRPCSLAVVLLLHFGATFGSLLVLQAFPQWPSLVVICHGVFVVLITLMSVAYLVFCCYTRADAKHVYHLSNTLSPRRGWDREVVMAGFSAAFMLACAGLQLYATLHALALAPAPALDPWPWWGFQLSCRLCEAVASIALALAATPPLHRPARPYHQWPAILCDCACRGDASAKPAALSVGSEWELRQQEKLAICEGVGCEHLPLYALVDPNPCSLEGLDLLYHGAGVLSRSDSYADTPLKARGGSPGSSYASLRLDGDSTADLRPPSPINLRRSIDEALFSPALFPHSLFSPAPLHGPRRGSTGLTPPPTESSADQALYRTSSCKEIEPEPPLIGSCLPGHAQWVEHRRGSSSSGSLGRESLDGSSVVLCPSLEACGHCRIIPSNLTQQSSNQGSQSHRCHLGPASTSQENSDQLGDTDRAIQEEFIRVCRQIDALSISSDTIDL